MFFQRQKNLGVGGYLCLNVQNTFRQFMYRIGLGEQVGKDLGGTQVTIFLEMEQLKTGKTVTQNDCFNFLVDVGKIV